MISIKMRMIMVTILTVIDWHEGTVSIVYADEIVIVCSWMMMQL